MVRVGLRWLLCRDRSDERESQSDHAKHDFHGG
jgi:hypothetical protein